MSPKIQDTVITIPLQMPFSESTARTQFHRVVLNGFALSKPIPVDSKKSH